MTIKVSSSLVIAKPRLKWSATGEDKNERIARASLSRGKVTLDLANNQYGRYADVTLDELDIVIELLTSAQLALKAQEISQ